MKKLLLIALLIVGCSTESQSIESLLQRHLSIDISDKYEMIKDSTSDNKYGKSQRFITLKLNKEELNKVSSSIDELISTGQNKIKERSGRWTKHGSSYIFSGGVLTQPDWNASVVSQINLNEQILNYILTYNK